MKVLRQASLNADFECSVVGVPAALGVDSIVVHHGCKDGITSACWVVVRVPDGKAVHIDVRDISGAESPPMIDQAKLRWFSEQLALHFRSASQLLDWAAAFGALIVENGKEVAHGR